MIDKTAAYLIKQSTESIREHAEGIGQDHPDYKVLDVSLWALEEVWQYVAGYPASIEDRFTSKVTELINELAIDPKEVPRLMDEVYRATYDLPMKVIYSQFLGDNFSSKDFED